MSDTFRTRAIEVMCAAYHGANGHYQRSTWAELVAADLPAVSVGGWYMTRLRTQMAAALDALHTLATAEGLRLVPVEATEGMTQAAGESMSDINTIIRFAAARGVTLPPCEPDDYPLHRAYRAMIAAAPDVLKDA